jgi:hypothetical protein
MALIQWKQIDSYLSGSKALTGSLDITGSLNIDGPITFNGELFTNGIFKQTGSYYSTTNDLKVTGSFQIELDGVEDYFGISVNGEEKIKVNEEGTFQMTAQTTTPTAISGGMFYSGSDEFFLGFNN